MPTKIRQIQLKQTKLIRSKHIAYADILKKKKKKKKKKDTGKLR